MSHSLSDSLVQPLAGHSRRRLLAGTDCLLCIWILCSFVANTRLICQQCVTCFHAAHALVANELGLREIDLFFKGFIFSFVVDIKTGKSATPLATQQKYTKSELPARTSLSIC